MVPGGLVGPARLTALPDRLQALSAYHRSGDTWTRWEVLQATLRATSPTERPKNRFYPLTGHTYCACGGTISGTYRADRQQRFYKCSRTASKLDPVERCPHYPRTLPAEQIESQVWEAVYQLLTDPDRLRQAVQRQIAAATQAAPEQRNQRASLARRLDELDIEESGVNRTHAREQINDTQLTNALGLIADERDTIRQHLTQLDLWDQRSTAHRAQLEALKDLARDAKRNLADPTPQDQRRIYQLLQLRINVTADRTLDIAGSIPTHGVTEQPEKLGKVSQGAPRDP